MCVRRPVSRVLDVDGICAHCPRSETTLRKSNPRPASRGLYPSAGSRAEGHPVASWPPDIHCCGVPRARWPLAATT